MCSQKRHQKIGPEFKPLKILQNPTAKHTVVESQASLCFWLYLKTQMAAPPVHPTCQWRWVQGGTADSTQQCCHYILLRFSKKLQNEAWRFNVSMNTDFAFHWRYRSCKHFCKLRGQSLHSYVCRHCLPRWLTNSSNGSVFEHNAAAVNIQILPCLGKAFSRCLKMGWLIIKTGVIQARGTSEMSQQKEKRLLCFLTVTDLTTFCFFWKTEMLHLGWHQGVWSGCGIV